PPWRTPSEVFFQVHAGVEQRDLGGVAVEKERRPPPELADAAFRGLTPARVVHPGVHVGVKAVLVGANWFHVDLGWSSTSLMRTIDLIPLNPYFHGTTRRSGAPFCGGRVSP